RKRSRSRGEPLSTLSASVLRRWPYRLAGVTARKIIQTDSTPKNQRRVAICASCIANSVLDGGHFIEHVNTCKGLILGERVGQRVLQQFFPRFVMLETIPSFVR